MVALLRKSFAAAGSGFPFGSVAFAIFRKYQLQISMSTFIVYRVTYIDGFNRIVVPARPRIARGRPKRASTFRKKAMPSLTEEQARAAIAPWYGLFNVASRGDVKTIQEQILTEDYESCTGYLPGECWGRETSIKVVSNFSNTIPDMKFDIKEGRIAKTFHMENWLSAIGQLRAK